MDQIEKKLKIGGEEITFVLRKITAGEVKRSMESENIKRNPNTGLAEGTQAQFFGMGLRRICAAIVSPEKYRSYETMLNLTEDDVTELAQAAAELSSPSPKSNVPSTPSETATA